MLVPLTGGSYVARSRIANAQRCINYFPEINREDSPFPFTFYQRPGLRQLAQANPQGAVRMLYQASNGAGYAVIGKNVYVIGINWTLTLLGQVSSAVPTPCKATDNGMNIFLVDGSTLGWTINMSTNQMTQINDLTGSFTGANTLGAIDTFLLFNKPGTNLFGSTLSNVIQFDPLYFAGKSSYADPLISLIVNRREVLLLGSLKSEIWYDAGNPQFPFSILPGIYIEHGCAATYSPAASDIETFWLSRDLQGKGMVMALKGYDVRRISNHALEHAIQTMPTISDAIGYTYQQEGHTFYVLTFPSGDQTWAYDTAVGRNPEYAWHQRAWTDSNGALHRDRLMSVASINEIIVGGDISNGSIYALDLDHYTDDLGGVAGPISYIKGFPHIFKVPGQGGYMPVTTDNKRYIIDQFIADMDCGDAALDAQGNPAKVGLAVSVDRGKSFGQTVLQSAGAPGEYSTIPTWKRAGLGRDIVFELRHSIAGPAALNGAWVDASVQQS